MFGGAMYVNTKLDSVDFRLGLHHTSHKYRIYLEVPIGSETSLQVDVVVSCSSQSNGYTNSYWYKPTQPAAWSFGSAGCNEALTGTKGSGYRGCQTRTKSGYTCQKWTAQSPHGHTRTETNYPSGGLGDHNYCRNPDGEPSIWC